MKVSHIGLISKKIENLDKQFPAQDMLLKTGQIEQFSSGIYAYGHIPYLLKKKVDEVICKTLTKYGCSELLLPILQPENIWKESGRLERYVNDGVMFRALTENGNYCLAPTAEEAVVAYAKPRLTTYKQLPVTYFQIGPKFRDEIRTRGILLRGKAFDMMDAYSFGKDKDDLDVEYERMKKAYIEIFEQLGLKVLPVGADSGSIGGSKSEEFMCLSDLGEDTILFDNETNQAFNSELLEMDNYKEYLLNTYGIKNTDSLTKKRAVELGHIFQLGDKYSKSMNATFVGQDNNPHVYFMGCYGIGVSRTLAMIYETNAVYKNDKFEGVALPVNLAPYTLYFIPKTDDAEKLKIAEDFYSTLQESGVNILFDDRKDVSIGVKIKDSKITGTPFTCVFGRTLEENKIEIENNKTGEKIAISLENFVEYCKNI